MIDKPKKRSLTLFGHRTSISLEDSFWQALKETADLQTTSLTQLVEEIDRQRGDVSLSSAIRVYLLQFYQHRARQNF